MTLVVYYTNLRQYLRVKLHDTLIRIPFPPPFRISFFFYKIFYMIDFFNFSYNGLKITFT